MLNDVHIEIEFVDQTATINLDFIATIPLIKVTGLFWRNGTNRSIDSLFQTKISLLYLKNISKLHKTIIPTQWSPEACRKCHRRHG